jgi:hypothetical protein
MQVEMTETRDTNDQRQREIDTFVAQSRALLATSKEHREYVDRTVAEAVRNVDRALAQLRRGY